MKQMNSCIYEGLSFLMTPFELPTFKDGSNLWILFCFFLRNTLVRSVLHHSRVLYAYKDWTLSFENKTTKSNICYCINDPLNWMIDCPHQCLTPCLTVWCQVTNQVSHKLADCLLHLLSICFFSYPLPKKPTMQFLLIPLPHNNVVLTASKRKISPLMALQIFQHSLGARGREGGEELNML